MSGESDTNFHFLELRSIHSHASRPMRDRWDQTLIEIPLLECDLERGVDRGINPLNEAIYHG